MKINHFILGSGSTFRATVLRSLGFAFQVVAPSVNEEEIHASDPAQLALARALAKARAVAGQYPAALVLGADQTVDHAGRCFGKAANREEAGEQLRALSDKTHYLHSAFCLCARRDAGDVIVLAQRVVSVPMTMRKLTHGEVEHYLDTLEWQGCAGCYRFEARGGLLFAAAGGTNTDIIGLPVIALAEEMRRIGINLLLQPAGPWQVSDGTPHNDLS